MPKATGDKVEGKGSSLEGEVPLAKPEGRSLTPKTCLLGPKTGLLGVTVALFDPPRYLRLSLSVTPPEVLHHSSNFSSSSQRAVFRSGPRNR